MPKPQKKKQQSDKKKKGNTNGQNQGNGENNGQRQDNNQNQQSTPQKFYKTSNMHSIFHQEYFENGPDFPNYDLYKVIQSSIKGEKTIVYKDDKGKNIKEKIDEVFEKIFKSRNQQLSEFEFDLTTTPLNDENFKEGKGDDTKLIEGFRKIQLETTYPGLLIGIGYPHGFSAKGSLKASLQFDYVTGLPHVPGSSLKGMLRSAFPLSDEELTNLKNHTTEERRALKDINEMKTEYIRDTIKSKSTNFGSESKNETLSKKDVLELRDLIFGEFDSTDKSSDKLAYQSSDVFLGGFPSAQKNELNLLELEYITPHDKEGFKNPTPIPLLKVKPGISFEFGFILKDTRLQSGTTISVADKVELFTQILEDFGVGAKTNVGFGQLVKKEGKD